MADENQDSRPTAGAATTGDASSDASEAVRASDSTTAEESVAPAVEAAETDASRPAVGAHSPAEGGRADGHDGGDGERTAPSPATQTETAGDDDQQVPPTIDLHSNEPGEPVRTCLVRLAGVASRSLHSVPFPNLNSEPTRRSRMCSRRMGPAGFEPQSFRCAPLLGSNPQDASTARRVHSSRSQWVRPDLNRRLRPCKGRVITTRPRTPRSRRLERKKALSIRPVRHA